MENLTFQEAPEKILNNLSNEKDLFYTICCNIILTLALGGSVTNVINIIVFHKLGIKDCVTLSFIHLSFSDLTTSVMFFCIFAQTINPVPEYRLSDDLTIDPFVVRYILANFKDCCYALSAMVTLYLSIAKTMCVAKPLTFKSTFTTKRTNMASIIFCFLTAILYAPALLTIGVADLPLTYSNQTKLVIYYPAEAMVAIEVKSVGDLTLTFTTQILTVVCVITLIQNLKRSVKFRASVYRKPETESSPEPANERITLKGRELQAIQQVATVSGVYIFCNTLKVLTALCRLAIPEFGFGLEYESLYASLVTVRMIFEVINCFVNIFIYAAFNEKFRKCLLNQ